MPPKLNCLKPSAEDGNTEDREALVNDELSMKKEKYSFLMTGVKNVGK